MSKELKNVLFIDDDRNMRQVVELALKAAGDFKVTTCRTYLNALDVIKDINPDLILLDIVMPEVNGLEALKEMRKKGLLKNVPVIFVTAKVKPNEIGHYIHLGAIGVIAKPFDPAKLHKQIMNLWLDYIESRAGSGQN